MTQDRAADVAWKIQQGVSSGAWGRAAIADALRDYAATAREEDRREGAEAVESVNKGISTGSYRAGRRAGIEEVGDWYWQMFHPHAPPIKADAWEILGMIRALADKEPT